VLRLLEDLSQRLGLAILFISHDLATVATLAHRVAVMQRGEIVETGPTADLLARPRHPYTRLLLDSVPELRIGWLEEALRRNRATVGRDGPNAGDRGA
jgi:peptide/nickel transport system ATP-binding protein